MFVQTNKCDTFMITMGENTKQMNEQQQQQKSNKKQTHQKKPMKAMLRKIAMA